MPRRPNTAVVAENADLNEPTFEVTDTGRAALAAPESTDEVEEEEIPTHELDWAPIGSKLVGTDQGVVFARPDGGQGRGGETLLPKTDVAGKLPAGARIQKIGEGVYRGVQLDSGREDKPALITATALECIQQFVPYFHG
jgi:hypothetical protein